MRQPSTPGNRGRRRAGIAGGVALTVVAGWAYSRPVLGRGAVEQTFGCTRRPVGSSCFFGALTLYPRGRGDVHVTGARVTGLPPGIQVVSYQAVSWAEGSDVAGVGLDEPVSGPRFRLHPVTDVVARPGKPELWRIVVTLRITQPGTWTTRGLDVSWRQGWRRGTAHFPYHFQLSTQTAEDIERSGR
jgi:hypothetical protein